MISIVFASLIPESLEMTSYPLMILGLIIGILIIMGLSFVVDRIEEHASEKGLHATPEELFHQSQLIDSPNSKNLIRSGILMFFAIALHSAPEGLAVTAGAMANMRLGIMIGTLMALHNITEGMAIAAPLIAGGFSRSKTVGLTALAGATTVFGGIVGVLVGSISDAAIALSLAVAGGAMLYVVFAEVIPQVVLLRKDQITTLVLILGIIGGLVITHMI